MEVVPQGRPFLCFAEPLLIIVITMHTVSSTIPHKAIAFGFAMFVVISGLFTQSTRAHASVSTETMLPQVHEVTELVLNSINQRITSPQMSVVATSQSAEIARLTKLLQELIAIYTAIVASNQNTQTIPVVSDVDDSVTDNVELSETPKRLYLNSISPRTATQGVPTTFTLTGSNFKEGATVRFRFPTMTLTYTADSVSAQGDTLTVTSPLPAPSQGHVSVCNADGSCTVSQMITVKASDLAKNIRPTLDSVTPNTAVEGVPTTYTLTGSNFRQSAVVKFWEPNITGSAQYIEPSHISSEGDSITVTATLPISLTQKRLVAVQYPDGTISAGHFITMTPK